MITRPMSRLLKVFQAGRMDYKSALQLQKKLADRHHDPSKSNDCHDTLILVEHHPVYTTGIRSKSYTIADEHNLRSLGADFYRTNRGGLITFHGPGQLVAYPIIDLKHFTPSVRWYVNHIEKTVIHLCKVLGIEATTSPNTGVWVGENKICAIGIHGSRFITTHGLALNCNTNLDWYDHIVPCGIEGKGVTSLSRELDGDFSIDDAIPIFLQSFSHVFNCNLCDFPKDDMESLNCGNVIRE